MTDDKRLTGEDLDAIERKRLVTGISGTEELTLISQSRRALELEAEVEKLRGRLHLESRMPDGLAYQLQKSEIEELRTELAEARGALEFYGNKENWATTYQVRGCGCCSDEIHPKVFEDNGAAARAALAKLEGGRDD